jgi:hypothetical protein
MGCYALLRILVPFHSVQLARNVKGEEVMFEGIVRLRAAGFPSSVGDVNSMVTQRLCSGVKGSRIDCMAQ